MHFLLLVIKYLQCYVATSREITNLIKEVRVLGEINPNLLVIALLLLELIFVLLILDSIIKKTLLSCANKKVLKRLKKLLKQVSLF